MSINHINSATLSKQGHTCIAFRRSLVLWSVAWFTATVEVVTVPVYEFTRGMRSTHAPSVVALAMAVLLGTVVLVVQTGVVTTRVQVIQLAWGENGSVTGIGQGQNSIYHKNTLIHIYTVCLETFDLLDIC